MPMHYAVLFTGCENANFFMKKSKFFSEDTSRLWVHVKTASLRNVNKYPQSMFNSKNKKKCIPL